jgi:L-lysine 6-transaminase
MFRFKRILEIIKEDDLVSNAESKGKYLLNRIYELQNKYPDKISNGRGLGLFCAFDCTTPELRNKIMSESHKNNMLILGCGEKSLRFRPSLAITEDEINEGFAILDKVISDL